MTTLKCIIVDDEPLAVRLIQSFVERTPNLELLSAHTDPVEALEAIRSGQANLVFLDIQMPDIDGMELARSVPATTRIIFTTAFKEYAFESYEVSALDFLLKPIRYVKFLAAVEKAKQWFERTATTEDATTSQETNATPPATTIYIKVDGELRQVAFDSILYVAGMKDYVMFYLKNERKPLITHLTMKAVEEMLPTTKFLRVHRSYIVALDSIRKVDRNDCIYIGDEIIHVTSGYADAFHQYIKQLTP
ncbi:MAG: response regulator transcription factor [Prevotella sp.]|nr:response regulator transcription factor [Prevotella sp.]